MSGYTRPREPWRLIGNQGTAIWEGDEIIAQMPDSRTNHKEARKRAQLMASAPELLEALQLSEMIISHYGLNATEAGKDHPQQEALVQIREAIALATGETR